MEESSPAKGPSRVREVVWTIVLMMVAFVGGVFVGLHPNWIPITVPLPSQGAGTAADSEQTSLANPPTTMPTTQEAATTQP
jgi:hypothetical protein